MAEGDMAEGDDKVVKGEEYDMADNVADNMAEGEEDDMLEGDMAEGDNEVAKGEEDDVADKNMAEGDNDEAKMDDMADGDSDIYWEVSRDGMLLGSFL